MISVKFSVNLVNIYKVTSWSRFLAYPVNYMIHTTKQTSGVIYAIFLRRHSSCTSTWRMKLSYVDSFFRRFSGDLNP